MSNIILMKNRKFREKLFSRFTKAVVTYDLVKENDHIAVCISGGKDSMLMARLFQELDNCRKFPFKLTFLSMDPGYSEKNRKKIEENAARLDIPIKMFETPIFGAVERIEKSPCYLCARMRRGYLYKKAQDLGCNKIALGHHYDDVIETILMGMLWGGQIQTMMPRLQSVNFPGMQLIRPMYLIREDDIKAWRDTNGLQFLQCACRFTEKLEAEGVEAVSESKRIETKRIIQELKKDNPFVEANIFKSVSNINLATVLAYKKDGKTYSALDEVSDREI